MHIFKENLQNFSEFFPKIIFRISCVFKTILYIVNIIFLCSYEKELKFQRPFFGVKGGKGRRITALSPKFSCKCNCKININMFRLNIS